MTALVLYPLLTTALYYLGAKAMITAPLWSRYPGWLDKFLSCSACAGTWYGALVAITIGVPLDLDVGALPARAWYTPMLVAGCSMIWTPLVASLHVRAILAIEAEPIAAADVVEDRAGDDDSGEVIGEG